MCFFLAKNIIYEGPSNFTEYPQSNISLSCNATREVNVTVEWLKNDVMLTMANSSNYRRDENNTLFIGSVSDADSGIYECVLVKNGTIIKRSQPGHVFIYCMYVFFNARHQI